MDKRRLFVPMLGFALLACEEDAVSPNGGPFPDEWAQNVTHPFFTLIPGTVHVYRLETDEGVEIDTTMVLVGTKNVNGVEAAQVWDRVFVDGELTEETFDWYAQDADGNVWYLGEDTKEYENGEVVSTSGSFEWGKDGAEPGIIMWSNPAARIGEIYRQEYLEGEAEDKAMIVAVDQTVTVPLATLTGCIETEDWNPLEPNVPREHKFYCPNVGLTLEVAGNGERNELVALEQTLELGAGTAAYGSFRSQPSFSSMTRRP
jgi:hypothetical protein